jgi:hypothetical protein
VNIDWHQLVWDDRWTALEILWNAVVVAATTHWWFGPLLAAIVLGTSRKALLRFGVHIARTFGQAHGIS